MTGYTVHTGASKKFVSGWDKVFGSTQEKKSSANAKGKAKGENAKTVKKKKK